MSWADPGPPGGRTSTCTPSAVLVSHAPISREEVGAGGEAAVAVSQPSKGPHGRSAVPSDHSRLAGPFPSRLPVVPRPRSPPSFPLAVLRALRGGSAVPAVPPPTRRRMAMRTHPGCAEPTAPAQSRGRRSTGVRGRTCHSVAIPQERCPSDDRPPGHDRRVLPACAHR